MIAMAERARAFVLTRRAALLSGSAGVAGALGAACAPGGGESGAPAAGGQKAPVKIAYWGKWTGSSQEPEEAVIAAFQQKLPHITVEALDEQPGRRPGRPGPREVHHRPRRRFPARGDQDRPLQDGRARGQAHHHHPGRPDQAGQGGREEVLPGHRGGGALPARPGGQDHRPPLEHRRPGPDLQQAALHRGRPRPQQAPQDLGRGAGRGNEADQAQRERPRAGGVRRRRQRHQLEHRLALGGRRAVAQAGPGRQGQPQGCLQRREGPPVDAVRQGQHGARPGGRGRLRRLADALRHERERPLVQRRPLHGGQRLLGRRRVQALRPTSTTGWPRPRAPRAWRGRR